MAILALVLVLRHLGFRAFPLAMPQGKLKGLAVGLVGGYAGGLLLPWGFQWQDINLVGAALGIIAATLILGLLPFIKILLGRT
ncbi:MAG: hypothetical protein HY687_00570 [Chloroflexi bacterium]|nr:hypothetical protein [Chloroflexota bacterium]